MTGSVTADPLRIGVLGAARIADLAIVQPARLTGHRLVAVAARDHRRAEDFAQRHGVERALASYGDVLADPEVEAIYNPLANALHGPWNLAAIQAGKHVLSEKPFASNTDEARVVRDAAAAAEVTVMEGFHYLYHPVTRRLHELLDSGELGELRAVETDLFMPAPDDGDPRWSYELAGGALMDLGCYCLHAHRFLAPWAGGPPRLAADHRRYHCRIVGSRGEAVALNFVEPHQDDRIVVTTAAGTRTEALGRRSSYTYQLEAFAAHLRQGTPLPTDADDAVVNMQLVDDCYRAAGLSPRPAHQPLIKETQP
jgi:predicted dehydrogenase